MIVDCAHYLEGVRQHEGPMDLARAAEIVREDDGFVWLGIVEPDADELAEMQARFGLHDLAVEDVQSFHLRPKIEQYDEGGVYFAVLRTARYVHERADVEFGEVSVFMSDRFVITVRQGVASDLHPARLRLERRPELLREGTASVLWAILDQIVDDYAPVLEGLERDVEELEHTVFSGAAAATERIYFLRREATDFYRAVHPLLGPLEALERGAYLPVSPQLGQFYRDVNDHLKLVNEEVVAQRDLLAIVLQANMAVISVEQNEISVRQNETAKRLTLIATIFLPLTFITGFFGMNFGWLADHIDTLGAFLLFGVGSFVGAGIILLLWFRTGHPAGTERVHESPRLRALIPTDAATPPPSRPDPPASADAPAERRAPTRT
jgi:magnesium transporter